MRAQICLIKTLRARTLPLGCSPCVKAHNNWVQHDTSSPEKEEDACTHLWENLWGVSGRRLEKKNGGNSSIDLENKGSGRGRERKRKRGRRCSKFRNSRVLLTTSYPPCFFALLFPFIFFPLRICETKGRTRIFFGRATFDILMGDKCISPSLRAI